MKDHTMPAKDVMLLVATAIVLTGCLGSNNTPNSFARTARLNCDNQGLEFGTQNHRACMRKQWENKRAKDKRYSKVNNQALMKMGAAMSACSAYGWGSAMGAASEGKCTPPPKQNLGNLSQTNDIYDERNNHIGFIRNGIIYDNSSYEVGRVQNGIIYNNNSYQIGRIQGSTIYWD